MASRHIQRITERIGLEFVRELTRTVYGIPLDDTTSGIRSDGGDCTSVSLWFSKWLWERSLAFLPLQHEWMQHKGRAHRICSMGGVTPMQSPPVMSGVQLALLPVT